MICFSSSFVHNVLSVTILTRFHLHHSRHSHLINFPLQIRLFLYLLFFMMFFCGFFLPPFQPVIKCLKLTIQTLEQGVFIVNFELISHCVLVFVLLTLNRQIPSGLFYLPFENVCFLPSICFFFCFRIWMHASKIHSMTLPSVLAGGFICILIFFT